MWSFLDLSEAFDNVAHNVLIQKLKHHRLHWIAEEQFSFYMYLITRKKGNH